MKGVKAFVVIKNKSTDVCSRGLVRCTILYVATPNTRGIIIPVREITTAFLPMLFTKLVSICNPNINRCNMTPNSANVTNTYLAPGGNNVASYTLL